MNDSSTGGYLIPFSKPGVEDGGFDQLLQPVIVGITGLPPALVWRGWQEKLPNQPADRTVNWCSFRTLEETADTNPTLVHDGQDDCGQGTTTEYRTEEAQVLTSFYGPDCGSYAAGLRDGFGISQNREAMRRSGLSFVQTERLNKLADLKGDAFIRRADLVFRVRRVSKRTYAIRNIVSLSGQVVTDAGAKAQYNATDLQPLRTAV